MRSAAFLIAMLGAGSLASCVAHAPPPSPPLPTSVSNAVAGDRFGDVRNLVLAEEREPVPLPVQSGPRYPDYAKRQGIQAIVPTAYIVDTLGAVEARSITFLDSLAAPLEFRKSLCDFLVLRARFEPLMRDGQRRRAFVLQPFGFTLQTGALSGVAQMAAAQREAVRRTSWDSVATLLEKQPHCR